MQGDQLGKCAELPLGVSRPQSVRVLPPVPQRGHGDGRQGRAPPRCGLREDTPCVADRANSPRGPQRRAIDKRPTSGRACFFWPIFCVLVPRPGRREDVKSGPALRVHAPLQPVYAVIRLPACEQELLHGALAGLPTGGPTNARGRICDERRPVRRRPLDAKVVSVDLLRFHWRFYLHDEVGALPGDAS